MDYIYLPCVQRFKDSAQLFVDSGLQPIAHFDRFKGQYLNPEMHQPWAKPAVFFKFNISWEDLSSNTQKGKGILEIHLELENYGESADGSPDQAYALQDYEYQRIVAAILHGFKTANFTGLKRRSTDEDENPSNTNVTIIRFEFEIIDESFERYRNWLREKLDDLTLKKKPADFTPPALTDDDKYII
jgi:hypothetical protein